MRKDTPATVEHATRKINKFASIAASWGIPTAHATMQNIVTSLFFHLSHCLRVDTLAQIYKAF